MSRRQTGLDRQAGLLIQAYQFDEGAHISILPLRTQLTPKKYNIVFYSNENNGLILRLKVVLWFKPQRALDAELFQLNSSNNLAHRQLRCCQTSISNLSQREQQNNQPSPEQRFAEGIWFEN